MTLLDYKRFDKLEMASYDDLGKTGMTSAWVLEQGTYTFFIGTSGNDGKLCYDEIGSYVQQELEVVEQLEPVCSLQEPIDRIVAIGTTIPAGVKTENLG